MANLTQLPFELGTWYGNIVGPGNINPGWSLGRIVVKLRVLRVGEDGTFYLQWLVWFEVTQGDSTGFEGSTFTCNWNGGGPFEVWSFSGNPYFQSAWWEPDGYAIKPGQTYDSGEFWASYTDGRHRTSTTIRYTVPEAGIGTPSVSIDKPKCSPNENVTLSWKQGTTPSGKQEAIFDRFEVSDGMQTCYTGTGTSMLLSPTGILEMYGADKYANDVAGGKKNRVVLKVRQRHEWYGTWRYSPWVSVTCDIETGQVTVYTAANTPKKGAVYVYGSDGKPKKAAGVFVYDASGKPKRAI